MKPFFNLLPSTSKVRFHSYFLQTHPYSSSMDPLPFSFLFLIMISSQLVLFPIYGLSYDERYLECASFSCGEFENITFPFWESSRASYCGLLGYKLECEGDNLTMMLGGQTYQILDMIKEKHRITVARVDLLDNICPQQSGKFTFGNHFNFTDNDLEANLVSNCQTSQYEYNCSMDAAHQDSYMLAIDQNYNGGDYNYGGGCGEVSMVVPMLKSSAQDVSSNNISADEALKKGFEISWNLDMKQCTDCVNSEGRCGYNTTLEEFSCFCSDGVHQTTCSALVTRGFEAPAPEAPSSRGMSLKRKFKVAGIAVAATTIVAMLVGMFVFLKYRKRRQPKHSYVVSRTISSDYSSRTGLEKDEAYYGLPLFEYNELKEATNNFDPGKELGDGGFGTVFYGKLQDGRAVAVKRLYENNYKRTAQFMNEVEILAKLHHPNLVILYGCTSRQSYRLLLVYEYIPNGTVADHLHGDRAKPGSLPWSIRMNIALQTASALVYLHASDIVHRDVKTNNILLDENFKVKVADFGLSRLFPLNVTHVSTAPQGTPGYVDPEYHQCYQLTDKSDVYSFGVVLMELISSLPAVDITRHRHEINLSTMAINKIQSDALHELVDPHLGFDSDSITRRMIEAVAELGFQCLQHGKDMRPSMAEVMKTLQDIHEHESKTDKKVQENDTHSDDVVLLKVDPLMLSPDSVMVKWASMNPTPNTSA